MKIVVTDACIFIDLFDLRLMSHFFELQLEIHTFVDVYNELDDEQKQLLMAYKVGNKLTIHNLNSEDFELINKTIPSKTLSPPDKTVIYLADKINAIILSSDKTLRNCAKTKAIEYHGILWIFDKLIDEKIISGREASVKLIELTEINFFFKNNLELSIEINKRIKIWSK